MAGKTVWLYAEAHKTCYVKPIIVGGLQAWGRPGDARFMEDNRTYEADMGKMAIFRKTGNIWENWQYLGKLAIFWKTGDICEITKV